MDIAFSPGYRFVKGLVKATYYIPTFAPEQSLLIAQEGLLKNDRNIQRALTPGVPLIPF